MSFVVDMRKVLKVKMGIHLSAANAGMAEQFLHRAQIAARLQQVAGEAVTQHVRMHMNAEARLSCALREPAANAGG